MNNIKIFEDNKIADWLKTITLAEWTSIHEITRKYNNANKPFVITHKKMGNTLVKLGYFRKTMRVGDTTASHYVKGE